MIFKRLTLLAFLSIYISVSYAQIHAAKVIYERKTNLYKKFKERNVSEWIKEEDKNKVDIFELYFNDTLSCFKPQESDLKEQLSWATSKFTTFQNFKTKETIAIKDLWGEKFYLKDTVKQRSWKITESKRNIAGYTCRKAIWQADDSTRIYAWYCNELECSTGPESFCGLPGTILGLASEDGGIIYFAKSVEVLSPTGEQLSPGKIKKKIYNPTDLRKELETEYGSRSWGKAMLKNLFGYF